MVPYWIFNEAGILGKLTDERRMRPVGLAISIQIWKRGRRSRSHPGERAFMG